MSSVLLGQDANAERGREQAGVTYHVAPRHRGAPQPVDARHAVERARPQLAAVDAHTGHVGLAQVAVVEAHRAQQRLAELGLAEPAAVEGHAVERRARARREVDAAAPETDVADPPSRPVAGAPGPAKPPPPQRDLAPDGLREVPALNDGADRLPAELTPAGEVRVDE